ncbi:phage holin family protein [Bacteroidota bacterium]
MKEQSLIILSSYIKKSFIVCEAMMSKKGLVLSAPILISLPVLTQMQQAVWLLFWLMLSDFATGILAAWFEKSKAEKNDPKIKEQSLISSEKLKKSGFKILLYVCSILAIDQAQKVFKLKPFNLSFSDLELSITLVVIFFWCLVEFYSIVFENFKRMGFDVAKKISNVFTTVKNIKSEIKD